MDKVDSAESFGPYEIVRRLAVGGMSEVLLARHYGLEGLERRVVIKRIREGLSRDEEFRTMFLDEARLMAALCHPNIAQVFELGQVGESYHLVMEFVRGPTLNTTLHAASKHGLKGFPPHIALQIAIGVAEAMAYVHSCKDDLGRPLRIVHRDLKPANIIVSYDGAVKLIDFGIAKAASKVYETRTGVIKGTYGYIAPEQLTQGAPVDHRVDLFALGVILYEMVVGEHPFDAGDNSDMLDRIINARYERPRKIVPTVPRSLDKLITQCLAPHPEGRPESMNVLIDQLIGEQLALGKRASMADVAEFVKQLVPDTHGPAPLKAMSEHRSVFPDLSVAVQKPEATETTTAEGHAGRIYPLRSEGPFEGTQRIPKSAVALNGEHHFASEPPSKPTSDWDEILTMVAPSETSLPMVPSRANARLPVHLSSTPPPRKGKSWPWLIVSIGVLLLGAAYLIVPVFPKPEGLQSWLQRTGIEEATQQLPFDFMHVPVKMDDTAHNHESQPSVKMRSMRITSDPEGATIVLNGETLAEKTPATIQVPTGQDRVSVRVSKQGYAGYLQEISPQSDSEHFILLPLQSPTAKD